MSEMIPARWHPRSSGVDRDARGRPAQGLAELGQEGKDPHQLASLMASAASGGIHTRCPPHRLAGVPASLGSSSRITIDSHLQSRPFHPFHPCPPPYLPPRIGSHTASRPLDHEWLRLSPVSTAWHTRIWHTHYTIVHYSPGRAVRLCASVCLQHKV